MPATVQIRRHTGAAGSQTKTDVTSINTRLNAEDAHTTAGTTNPVQVPTSGTKYSFWASFRLNCSVAPSGTIDNIRWYTDASNNLGTGLTMKVATASAGADAGYRQATGSAGDTGTQLTTGNHTGLDGSPADAFTYSAGSPLAVAGSITATTGEFGRFVVLQIEVGTTAGPGASAQETITWKYDET